MSWDSTGRAARVTLGGLWGLGAALRVRGALQPVTVADGTAAPDDAWYVLDVARSIARTGEALYGDQPTDGFQPLHGLLASLAFHGRGDSVPELDAAAQVARVPGLLADLVFPLLLVHLVARGRAGPATGATVLALWATHPAFLEVAFNGLETSLALAAAAGVLVLVDRWVDDGPLSRAPLLGLALGVAYLCRVDAGLLAPAFAAVCLARAHRAGRTPRGLAFVGLAAAGALVPATAWWAWIVPQTGRFVPVSGDASRHIGDTLYGTGIAARLATLPDTWSRVVAAAPALWQGALLVGVLLLVAARRDGTLRWPRAAWPVVLGLWLGMLVVLYGTVVRVPWFTARHLAPALVVPMLVLALAARRAAERWGNARVALPIAVVTLLGLASPGTRQVVFGPPVPGAGYRELGLWARTLPAGSVVGALQSGALGYYGTSVRVYNLDGVVDERALTALRSGRPLDHLDALGVDHLVGHTNNIAVIAGPDPDRFAATFEPVGEVPGVRSWGQAWEWYRRRAPAGVPAPGPPEP